MTLRFVGHACFVAESDDGRRVILDPFRPGAFGRFSITPFRQKVDVVVSTHAHLDHYHVDPAFGTPHVVCQSGHAAGFDFIGVELPHGRPNGRDHGFVTGFRFVMDDIVFFHPGDIGRVPTSDELAQIQPVDVLFVPVGGTFTLGPEDAWQTVISIAPRIAIPMHHQDPNVDLPLVPVEDFLAMATDVESVGASVTLSADKIAGICGKTPKILHMNRV